MKSHRGHGSMLVSALLLAVSSASAQIMPQESWVYLDNVVGGMAAQAVATDDAGRMHVVTLPPTTVRIFDSNGNQLRAGPTGSGICDIAADGPGNSYVAFCDTGALVKYNLQGTELARFSFDPGGTVSLDLLSTGEVVLNSGTTLYFLSPTNLQPISTTSGPIKTDVFAYESGRAVAALPLLGFGRFGVYGVDGVLQRIDAVADFQTVNGYWNGVYACDNNCGGDVPPGFARSAWLASTGGAVGSLFQPLPPPQTLDLGNVHLGKTDLLYVAYANQTFGVMTGVFRFKRGYRSPLGAVSNNAMIPSPVITDIVRRSGTSVLDIDFIVKDGDSATVEAWPIAFKQNVRSLANAVVPSALVDGTVTNRGTSVATQVSRRLSWDVLSDASVGGSVEQFRVEILAKDARPIQEVHWATIPANIPTNGLPSLKISAQPLREGELLNMWFWYVARSDSAIQFANGEVRGTSGVYNGQLLASGTTTTALGKQFLFQEKLGVRAATPQETARAVAGSSEGNQQYVPRTRTTRMPEQVNELGIEVGVVGDYVVDI